MSWTNEQVAMLIEEYEKYPSLYTAKHPEYYNKNRRSLYLQQIASTLACIRPNTTETDIHKKFTGLRNTYACERRKYVDSRKSGAGDDEVYIPSLWYFDKLKFLNSHLGIRKSKSNLFTDTVSAQAEAEPSEKGQQLPVMFNVSEPTKEEFHVSENELVFSPEAYDDTQSFDFSHNSSVTPSPIPRKRLLIRETEVLDSSAAKRVKDISSVTQTTSTKKDSPVEPNDDAIYAAYVQTRLACITDKMRKIRVKHAIDNLLYDAMEEEAKEN